MDQTGFCKMTFETLQYTAASLFNLGLQYELALTTVLLRETQQQVREDSPMKGGRVYEKLSSIRSRG